MEWLPRGGGFGGSHFSGRNRRSCKGSRRRKTPFWGGSVSTQYCHARGFEYEHSDVARAKSPPRSCCEGTWPAGGVSAMDARPQHRRPAGDSVCAVNAGSYLRAGGNEQAGAPRGKSGHCLCSADGALRISQDVPKVEAEERSCLTAKSPEERARTGSRFKPRAAKLRQSYESRSKSENRGLTMASCDQYTSEFHEACPNGL